MTILSRRDSHLFRIFVQCPSSLLTLCHHSRLVYDDDDDENDHDDDDDDGDDDEFDEFDHDDDDDDDDDDTITADKVDVYHDHETWLQA